MKKVFNNPFICGISWGCLCNTGINLCFEDFLKAGIWLIVGSVLLFLQHIFNDT